MHRVNNFSRPDNKKKKYHPREDVKKIDPFREKRIDEAIKKFFVAVIK